MPCDRLAAVDDRAIAARTAVGTAASAAQYGFLDQLEPDAFARRHERHCQRRFGEAVARAEGGSLEAGIGEGVDERLHDVGPDHVRAVAGDPPAGQVEPVLGAGLRRHAARADVIAEGRRVAEEVPGLRVIMSSQASGRRAKSSVFM